MSIDDNLDLDANRALEIFSYSHEEQQTFPYLGEYMRSIENELHELIRDRDFRIRFMLAGLFLTYRACNHQGMVLSTGDETLGMLSGVHAKRLEEFRRLAGIEITDTADYLKKIKMGYWRALLPWPGYRLAKFVRQG